MTAVNPIPPNATPDREQRPYEPSMEEILASIRRIIADDQSLPGRQDPPPPVDPQGADVRKPEPEATTVHLLRPVPAPEVISTSASADHVPTPPSFVAHGAIAPQFATPEGPVPAQAHARPHDKAPAETYPSFDHDHIGAPTAQDLASDRAPAESAFADDHHVYGSGSGRQPDIALVYDEPLGRHEPTPFEPAPAEPASLFSAATDQSITSAFNTLAATRLADNSEDLMSMSREMIRPLLKVWLDENLPGLVERLVRAEIERVARGGR